MIVNYLLRHVGEDLLAILVITRRCDGGGVAGGQRVVASIVSGSAIIMLCWLNLGNGHYIH